MIDLHIHTKYSDGSNTVEEIFKIAKSIGLTTIAITDHDTLFAISESKKYEDNFNIKNISGVEVSTRYHDNRELHILGYLFDENNKELLDTLEWIIKTRKERNFKLVDLLNELGYKITIEELIEVAEKETNIGRPHFARLLIQKGYFKTFDEVFSQLLGEGKSGYINRESISPYKAIETIHNAGGVAILAHPLSYHFEKKQEIKELISDLVKHDIDGIEAEYVTYNKSDISWLKKVAKEFNIIITGGSDYHGKYKPHISLGKGLGSLYVPDNLLETLYKARENNVL
jgi:hypothetical protein